MPLIKILKNKRTLVVQERIADRLIEDYEAEFLDVVETKKEVKTRHTKERNESREQARIEQKRQTRERQEARRNARLEEVSSLQFKKD
jgi:hypothetical protein